jgi:hypothetical protein
MRYDYKCSCGNKIEISTSSTDLNYITEFCDICKKRTQHRKVISLTNFKICGGSMNKDGIK